MGILLALPTYRCKFCDTVSPSHYSLHTDPFMLVPFLALVAVLTGCGDRKCDAAEDPISCPEDCPGVTTSGICGEEPHSDTGGYAVVFGINHRAASAQDCCDRCQAHAANPRNAKRPCNSWVFCPLPVCWGLDTGWNHTYGECWLKNQHSPEHAVYGQRGRYSDAFRRKHRHVRKTYYGADTPSHVPWTGGVIGGTVDLSVQWTTGIEGMNSNKGASLTNWRAWEQPGVYEKRLARAKGKGRGRGRGWRNSIDDVVQVVGAEPG